MNAIHDLILGRSWRRHAPAHELNHERYEIERDEYECEHGSLGAVQAVGRDVVIHHPCKEHVDESVDPCARAKSARCKEGDKEEPT